MQTRKNMNQLPLTKIFSGYASMLTVEGWAKHQAVYEFFGIHGHGLSMFQTHNRSPSRAIVA